MLPRLAFRWLSTPEKIVSPKTARAKATTATASERFFGRARAMSSAAVVGYIRIAEFDGDQVEYSAQTLSSCRPHRWMTMIAAARQRIALGTQKMKPPIVSSVSAAIPNSRSVAP